MLHVASGSRLDLWSGRLSAIGKYRASQVSEFVVFTVVSPLVLRKMTHSHVVQTVFSQDHYRKVVYVKTAITKLISEKSIITYNMKII